VILVTTAGKVGGEAARVPWLRRFYFGAEGEEGLKELVSDLGDIDARDVSSFPLAGTDITVRVGRIDAPRGRVDLLPADAGAD